MNDHVGGTALIDSEGGEDRSAPSVMRYPFNAVIGWDPEPDDVLKKACASATKTRNATPWYRLTCCASYCKNAELKPTRKNCADKYYRLGNWRLNWTKSSRG
ncbi:hypothetical protein KIH13_16890 [Pseudomonas viridiflava]|nr:hypothetical protein KIH13_16890 [Pseudomonas viridiflava]